MVIVSAFINATNIGAAYDAAFMFEMLENGIGQAIFLKVCDPYTKQEDGKQVAQWGWPATSSRQLCPQPVG